MPRLIRNTAILAKNESTYGTDAVPTGGANAILVSEMSIDPLKIGLIDRDLIRGYLGGSDKLIGQTDIAVKFSVELAGAGSAGSAAPWGVLARACGLAETLFVGNRAEYKPVSSGFEAVTCYYYDDGVLHKLLGVRGEMGISLKVGERPKLTFDFLGLDGVVSAAALPSLTLTGWQKPLPVLDANTGDITLGGTYSAGAISGGTAYPSQGLNLKLGNKVGHTLLLGGDAIDITDRDVSGDMNLDLTAAQEVTFQTTMKTPTLQSLSLLHGTTSGNKVLVYAPQAQLVQTRKESVNGRRLIGYDVECKPQSGNDELTIAVL